MTIKWVLFLLFVLPAVPISITVSSVKERCMIVSSNNQEQFLKVDLKFERFAEQTVQEGYRVVLHNTETHAEEAFQISEGIFRKQFKLTENVAYRLCFKIVLSNFRQINKLMEYNAGIKHKFSVTDSQISIPQKLLKSKDLRDTYTSLSNIRQLMQRVKKGSQSIKDNQTQDFEQQNKQMQIFQWITIIQFVVICLFGGFQYYKLRVIIQNKQVG